jgi:hypothetical protein
MELLGVIDLEGARFIERGKVEFVASLGTGGERGRRADVGNGCDLDMKCR